ncbi:unnamed protein product (macronuclear) [Paramecium tetraurelia]|uniref:CCT domain-containing protein n=1 Tax=Paramecium tetraurelia TaxID=5888 RepID=A0DXD5_PARTE|nr:uncharacterized protein GSPATT00021335001 [Paramecium tetraurelia]CAK87702.1 unnamed protein product [Paramecium tetraurelia]|eukprot:XP_001455099.1 hypothetical protein (macronuclear) [Paramecium tetraurelia strain d4-2]
MNICQFQHPIEYTSCIIDDESNQNILVQCHTNFQKKQSMNASTQEQTDYSEISQHEQDSTLLDIEVDQYLYSINLRHNPTFQQEEFIHNFLSHNTIQKLKLGLTAELAEDDNTKKFEEWLYMLRNRNGQNLARELKVKKYLEKKRNRTYEKRVQYQVRQKVAGERMRIKGRFITWRQAVKLLDGDESKKEWTYNDYFRIKALLYSKYNLVNNL